MESKLKISHIFFFLISAPFFGILSFFLLSTILGPFLSESIGELNAKSVFIFLSLSAVFMYGRKFFRPEKLNEYYPPNRLLRIVFAILSFAMAPFGFAGLLVSKSGGELPPILGGIFCIILGIFLIYGIFQKK